MAYQNKEKQLEYNREWRKKNRTKLLEVKRKWYHDNIDKVKVGAKKSREKHKEQRKLDYKKWFAKNKERSTEYHKEYNKKWYLENKESRSQQIKAYGEAHPKENVLRTQKYVSLHKDKVQQYNKEFGQTMEGKYRLILHRAKKWGAPYLTLEEFKVLFVLPCAYCGETKKTRGIDRIDNNLGYTKENSTSCCKECNFMKKAMKVTDFLSHIEKIHKFNNKT